MSDELVELLRHQIAALEVMEGRLRALELLAAAGQQRFVAVAFDELEVAAERVGALELTRVLSMTGLGLGPDATASDVIAAEQAEQNENEDEDGPMVSVVAQLRLATERVAEARDRARAVVADGREEIARRLEASGALAGV